VYLFTPVLLLCVGFRSVMDLVRSLAVIGRLSLASSLSAVSGHLSASMQAIDSMQHRAAALLDAAAGGPGLAGGGLQESITRQLEVQRMCSDLLWGLLVDSDIARSGRGGLAAAAVAAVSSEAPVIPEALLELCSGPEASGVEGMIVAAVSSALGCLQQQCAMHLKSKSEEIPVALRMFLDVSVSSLVIESLFKLLKEFIWYET
jgi:hypothetical protein